MKWVSVLSDASDYEEAVMTCARAISEQLAQAGLQQTRPTLVVAFPSSHHLAHVDELIDFLQLQLEPDHFFGCCGGGIIGGGHELEQKPGLAVMAAVLPEVTITPFQVTNTEITELHHKLAVGQDQNPQFLLLADPFSFKVDAFLAELDRAYPAAQKAGGLASSGRLPGENALFLDGRIHREGLVGLALSGAIEMDTLVAQGCRPIGQPMFITSCKENLLMELNNQPVRLVLQNLYSNLSDRDKELFRTALFFGIEMRPKDTPYAQGDFLIRNILGIDPPTGNLAVGAMLQETGVAQFHLRDALTSAEDLEQRLKAHKQANQNPPKGALLFSCLGRGEYLYQQPDHDTRLFLDHTNNAPLAGFFCNGEIGPVGGRTYTHGYTSSFALFTDGSRRD